MTGEAVRRSTKAPRPLLNVEAHGGGGGGVIVKHTEECITECLQKKKIKSTNTLLVQSYTSRVCLLTLHYRTKLCC